MYHLLREIFTRQNLGVVYFKALYQALWKQKMSERQRSSRKRCNDYHLLKKFAAFGSSIR